MEEQQREQNFPDEITELYPQEEKKKKTKSEFEIEEKDKELIGGYFREIKFVNNGS